MLNLTSFESCVRSFAGCVATDPSEVKASEEAILKQASVPPWDPRRVELAIATLSPFWRVVDELLEGRGGAVALFGLASGVSTCFEWKRPPSIQALAGLLSTNARYSLKGAVALIPTCPCLECGWVSEALVSIVTARARVSAVVAAREITADHHQHRCAHGLADPEFSPAFSQLVAEAIEGLETEGAFLCLNGAIRELAPPSPPLTERRHRRRSDSEALAQAIVRALLARGRPASPAELSFLVEDYCDEDAVTDELIRRIMDEDLRFTLVGKDKYNLFWPRGSAPPRDADTYLTMSDPGRSPRTTPPRLARNLALSGGCTASRAPEADAARLACAHCSQGVELVAGMVGEDGRGEHVLDIALALRESCCNACERSEYRPEAKDLSLLVAGTDRLVEDGDRIWSKSSWLLFRSKYLVESVQGALERLGGQASYGEVADVVRASNDHWRAATNEQVRAALYIHKKRFVLIGKGVFALAGMTLRSDAKSIVSEGAALRGASESQSPRGVKIATSANQLRFRGHA